MRVQEALTRPRSRCSGYPSQEAEGGLQPGPVRPGAAHELGVLLVELGQNFELILHPVSAGPEEGAGSSPRVFTIVIRLLALALR